MIRVMTYNICNGGSGREHHLAALIRHLQPDVLFLQEVMHSGWIEALSRTLTMFCQIASGNTFWKLACLSRYPILDWHSHHPFPPVQRTIFEVEILCPSQQRLRLFGIHLAPWFGLFTEGWRLWEISVVLRHAHRYSHQPCGVLGDLNSLSPEERGVFKALSPIAKAILLLQGGFAPRWVVKRMMAAGWVDAFRILHPTAHGYTFPVPNPSLRLDYLFVNPALRSALRACAPVQTPAVLINAASDHYPLMAEFEL